jgi:hypothetical protein
MPSPEIAAFLRDHFKSVWALELLLFLKAHAETSWSEEQLVAGLRTSDIIVATSIDMLVAGGLVSVDADGRAHYSPASDDLSRLVDVTQALYDKKPDRVRRVIVSSAATGLSAFADSFRLRND